MSTPENAAPPEEGQTAKLPQEGDVLAGKYRVEKVLGQGGMGVVVAAQHTGLRQKVAIKILLPDAAQRKDAVERFLREARASVSISNEHVARVSDVGTLENGLPYMVMEYLTGQDLGDILKARGALPIPEAVDHILQACEAIAEAHSLGIIHRDLKPANLFIARRTDGTPLVKVLDFGLSKLTNDTLEASLTQHNVIMGSPCYMSPEQIRSLKGLDARTDIWALGVILYQLLTGVRPFDAPSLGALFFTIGAESPRPPRERRPELPPALEAAILRCLDKDIVRRTQTVAELARSIAPFGYTESYLSVERIHRLLNDGTPLPTRRNGGSDSAPALPSAIALDDLDDNAATIAQPSLFPPKAESLRPPPAAAGYPQATQQSYAPAPLPSYAPAPQPGYPSYAPAPTPSYGPGARAQSQPSSSWRPPPPPRVPSADLSGSNPHVKSGSIPSIARDGSGHPDAMAPPRPRSSLATAAIAFALVAVGAVAGLGLRNVTAPTPAAQPPAAPTLVPAPSASASASAAPSSSASAVPATMGETPKPPAQPAPPK